MKESRCGLAVSLLFHGLLITGFVAVSARSPLPAKVVSLDFAILKDDARGQGAAVATRGDAKNGRKELPAPTQATVQRTPQVRQANTPRQERETPPGAPPFVQESPARGIVSDPDAQVAIPGLAGHGRAGGDASTAYRGSAALSSADGGGSRGMEARVLDYGRGTGMERDYQYIRDGILRNVRYPERARRMGWEGRVLLSFTVLESGTIRDARVTQSSGFSSLDESALEAVSKTVFPKKNSQRLLVTLPVEYRIE